MKGFRAEKSTFREFADALAENVEDRAFGGRVGGFPAGFEGLREFEGFDRLLGDFAVVPVGDLQLEADSGLTPVEFPPLGGVLIRRNLSLHPKVEKHSQFFFDLFFLAGEFVPVLPVLGVGSVGFGPDDLDDPLTDIGVFDLKTPEERQHLLVDLAFREA